MLENERNWLKWYDYLAETTQANSAAPVAGQPISQWRFMNWGYEPVGQDEPRPKLLETDEPDRLSIQMYDHLARRAGIDGKQVLEVGSGRGGGCDYLARYFKPQRVVGVDFSSPTVEFCNRF